MEHSQKYDTGDFSLKSTQYVLSELGVDQKYVEDGSCLVVIAYLSEYGCCPALPLAS